MNKKVLWMTQTAVMLALLITLQAVTKPLGQIVTGSCVNVVLCLTALMVGLTGGIAVGVISPICAFLLGIAPNLVTVIPIMVANVCYVVLLSLICNYLNQFNWRQPVALVTASVAKFLILYFLVVKVICNLASGALMGKKVGDNILLAPKMLNVLPAMFGWPQLVTALIGGGVALLIVPVLCKAIKPR